MIVASRYVFHQYLLEEIFENFIWHNVVAHVNDFAIHLFGH